MKLFSLLRFLWLPSPPTGLNSATLRQRAGAGSPPTEWNGESGKTFSEDEIPGLATPVRSSGATAFSSQRVPAAGHRR